MTFVCLGLHPTAATNRPASVDPSNARRPPATNSEPPGRVSRRASAEKQLDAGIGFNAGRRQSRQRRRQRDVAKRWQRLCQDVSRKSPGRPELRRAGRRRGTFGATSEQLDDDQQHSVEVLFYADTCSEPTYRGFNVAKKFACGPFLWEFSSATFQKFNIVVSSFSLLTMTCQFSERLFWLQANFCYLFSRRVKWVNLLTAEIIIEWKASRKLLIQVSGFMIIFF